MIILSASDLCLSFGTDVILDRISLGVGENDKIGIVGVNGAGKSMLLKMLAGRISPTSGEVYLAAGKTLGFLEQDTGLESEKTIYEEMLGAFPALVESEKRLADLVDQLGDVTLDAETHMTLAALYRCRGTFQARRRLRIQEPHCFHVRGDGLRQTKADDACG